MVACAPCYANPLEAEKHVSSGTGVTGKFETPYVCWELTRVL